MSVQRNQRIELQSLILDKKTSIQCPKCGNEHATKSGKVNNKQRYKCSACSYYFTQSTTLYTDADKQKMVIVMRLLGLSKESIAERLSINRHTVSNVISEYKLSALTDISINMTDAELVTKFENALNRYKK